MKAKRVLMAFIAITMLASLTSVFAVNVPEEVKTNAEVVVTKTLNADNGLLPDVTELKFSLEKAKYTLAKDGIEVTEDLSYMPEAGELTVTMTEVPGQNKKTGTNTYNLDFTGKEIGVYRYKLTEVDTGVEGVIYDTNTYYVDVYVVNQVDGDTGIPTGEVTVSDVVIWQQTENSEEKKAHSSSETTPNRVEYPFVNDYDTQADISVTKLVNGNYANVNQEFEFEVTLENLEDSVTYNIEYYKDGTLQEGGLNSNPQTVTKETASPLKLKLKHNENFVIKGLPPNVNYTIVEKQEATYTGKYEADGKEATGKKTGESELGEDVTATGTLLDNLVTNGVLENENIVYTNTKEYTSPTGIILNVLPFVVGTVVFGTLFVIVLKKRKQDEI